jgi:tetratricopeptide (TPR) repeat protein
MTRYASAILVLCCAASTLPGAPDLKEARQRWLKGNYEEAQEKYEELAKDAKLRSPATVGLSKALQSQGEYDKALAVVAAALKTLPKDADLLARKAELLHLRGKWDEAEKVANAALARKKDHFLARWVRAQVYRDRGDLKKADTEVRWFVRTYTERSNNDDDIKDPDELLLVGLAGCENARWNSLSDQFEFILTEVYKDALKADPDFWPAEYQAGMLLLEKYNRAEALDALDKALAINPSCAEALAGKGVAALMRFEFKEAESLAERALKVNPRLPEALRLRADVHLAIGNLPAALKELERARLINPRDERTLARIAACHHLQGHKKQLAALAEEVQKFDRAPAPFYFELGERLEERRRYAEAEKYYKLAAKLRPKMPGPLNGLGMLYMRLGLEKEAEPLLDKGFAADKFNVRVSNMRKVLRHLKSYKTLETKHFRLRYDPRCDGPLARYMAGYLEEIHAHLAKKFNYRPEGRILVELFSSHEMFSGRTVALPDLHTIGACTGKMVAIASPNGWRLAQEVGKEEPNMRKFNWARVLRHEVVHIFNLAQTNFLVPHWFTEGLAVTNEGFRRPPSWNKMLVERVPNKLLNLDNIDLAFMRPRDPLEWQQAYLQSQLYVEHVEKRYGKDAIGKLLAAFADGLSTAAALKKVCGVSKATFEKRYRAWLVEEVTPPLRGKRPREKRRTLKQLEAEYKKKPNDPDVCAELALRVLPRSRVRARRLAEQARDKQKNHPKACYVLAQLAEAGGDVKEQKRLLELGLDRKAPEPLVLRALAKLYYDEGNHKDAARVCELGRKADPTDREWLKILARVYAQLEDRGKQVGVLEELVATDADDLERRERLAKLLLEARKYPQAERYAREALEIDVKSKEARQALFKALEAQKKDDEVKRLKGILEGKG